MHPPAHALREPTAERLLAALRPETRGDRVAQHQQIEGLTVELATPHPVGVEGLLPQRLPDPLPRDGGLLHEGETRTAQHRHEGQRHDGEGAEAAHTPIPPRRRERGVNATRGPSEPRVRRAA